MKFWIAILFALGSIMASFAVISAQQARIHQLVQTPNATIFTLESGPVCMYVLSNRWNHQESLVVIPKSQLEGKGCE